MNIVIKYFIEEERNVKNSFKIIGVDFFFDDP
jgi:hypothetical protein